MGNQSNIKGTQYNKKYGNHTLTSTNSNNKTITKYYHLTSKQQQISFQNLVNKYQKIANTIPTILSIAHSQSYSSKQQQYGWQLKFNYLSMTLDTVIAQHRQNNIYFKEQIILQIFDCILSGLLAFSKQGLYHGDIRPANIFISNQHQISNHIIYSISLPLLLNNQSLSKYKNSPQNLIYISPEYLQQIQQDKNKPPYYQPNDIFSLGIIIFEMATLTNLHTQIYNLKTYKINFQNLKKKIYNCRIKYSIQLCDLILLMVQQRIRQRIKLSEVYIKLNQILLGKVNKGKQIYNGQNKLQEYEPDIQRNHKVQSQRFTSTLYVSKSNKNAWMRKMFQIKHNKTDII